MVRIVIVEDDQGDLAQLADCLRRYEQEHGACFSMKSYANPADFLDAYRSDCDLIFMDIERGSCGKLTPWSRWCSSPIWSSML